MKAFKMKVIVKKVLEVHVMAKDTKDANRRVVNVKPEFGILERAKDVELTYGDAVELTNKRDAKNLKDHFETRSKKKTAR